MKKVLSPLTATVLAAVLSLAATAVFAQTPGPAAPRRQADRQAVESAPRTNAGSPFEIEITSGSFVRNGKRFDATLENVVDLLRDRHNGVNIVISPGIPEFIIINLKLRATSLEQELDALRVASGMQFNWSGGVSMSPFGMPTPIDPATGQAITSAPAGTNAPLYVLSEASPPTEIKTRVEVFNLTHLLSSSDEKTRRARADNFISEVRDIVESTLETYNRSAAKPLPGPSFKFHPGANLLVVVGSEYPLDVTRKVLSTLSVTEAGPLLSQVFQLKYATPDDVIMSVNNAITDKRSKVAADFRTGSLILLATQPEIERIAQILENLDRPAVNPPAAGGADRKR